MGEPYGEKLGFEDPFKYLALYLLVFSFGLSIWRTAQCTGSLHSFKQGSPGLQR